MSRGKANGVNGGGVGTLLGVRHAAPATRAIVEAMCARGPMSGGDIARLTGLARSTVSRVVADLRDAGMVVEAEPAGPGARGVGRPSTPLMLNPDVGTCVGVHLGYDHIDVLVADVAHTVIAQESGPIAFDYAPAEAAARAHQLVRAVYSRNGLAPERIIGVGVSVSGPVADDGTVMHSSILPRFAGCNVQSVFEPVFGRPVFAANESNCAAVAEMTWGAASATRDFVLFKIDLGVGGAIVWNGRLVEGVAGSAGEFGHMSFDPDGAPCRCGNRGCMEVSASFVRPLAELSRQAGHPMTMDEAIAMACEGHPLALRLVRETAMAAGRGLAQIGTILNPPLILIGGRLALTGDILLEPLKRAYDSHVLIKARDVPAHRRTRIDLGRFTRTDSLMGAVGLVLRFIGRIDG
jgi:predicted NBD/HSP70 family sugar kinase